MTAPLVSFPPLPVPTLDAAAWRHWTSLEIPAHPIDSCPTCSMVQRARWDAQRAAHGTTAPPDVVLAGEETS